MAARGVEDFISNLIEKEEMVKQALKDIKKKLTSCLLDRDIL